MNLFVMTIVVLDFKLQDSLKLFLIYLAFILATFGLYYC